MSSQVGRNDLEIKKEIKKRNHLKLMVYKLKEKCKNPPLFRLRLSEHFAYMKNKVDKLFASKFCSKAYLTGNVTKLIECFI